MVILFVAIILLIRSKWGQEIIVNKAIGYVSEKTNTKIEIDKLFVTFGGNIMLNGLYLEDTKGDTLVYSKSLEANMPLWAIIKGNGMGVDDLDWQGLTLNIIRKDSVEGYNFQFLIDAFAPKDTVTVKPDTTANPLGISIGTLTLKEFDITFNDDVLGIESHFLVGDLSLIMDKIDLEKLDFRASKIDLSNATIKLTQSSVPEAPTEETSTLPFLAVDELNINNVIADYNSKIDDSRYYINIVALNTTIPKVDLNNNVIDIEKFNLNNSKIAVNTTIKPNITVEKDKDTIAVQEPFQWPNFKINVSNLNLNNNAFSYVNNNTKVKEGVFNSEAMVFENLSLIGKNIFLADKKAGLHIDKFSFNEASGNHLKQFKLNATLTGKELKISNISAVLNENKLKGDVKLSYESLASFIDKPANTVFSLSLPNFQVDLASVYQFQPDLRKNEVFQSLSKNYFNGFLEASGKLSSIKIPSVKVTWGDETELSLIGNIQNVTDINRLQFDIPQINAKTNKKSLLVFVNEDSLGVNLPKLITLNGSAKGGLKDIKTELALKTSQGTINLNGSFNNNKQLVFDADVKIDDYEIGSFLNNNTLENITLSVATSGKGNNLYGLNTKMLATVEKFTFNDFEINDLEIQGNFNEGKGSINTDYKNDNLNVNLLANVKLDSILTKASIDLDVVGANLKALGVVEDNIKASLKLNANFKGNLEKFNINASIKNGVVVDDGKSYILGGLTAKAFVDKDTTSATVKNKLINFKLQSNANPERLTKALQRHIKSYFYREPVVADTINKPVNIMLTGKISNAPVLKEVLLVNLQDLDTVNVNISFKEKARLLNAKITAPHINYAGIEIDSLAFLMHTDIDKFNFDLGFKEINSGPLSIKKTSIKGYKKNNDLMLDFLSSYENEKIINVQSSISGINDTIRFHVFNDNLIINKNKWQAPSSNEVLITKNKLNFNDFIFNFNDESIEIKDALTDFGSDRIDVDFRNFKLNKILNFLNPEDEIASGVLNGELSVENPFDQLGVIADLNIKEFSFLEVDLGTMKLNASSAKNNNYDFAVGLKEGQIDLDLNGNYITDSIEPIIKLNLDINKFNMKALEGFTEGEVVSTSGSFSGNFNLDGSLAKPIYNGQVNFNNAKFKVAQLNESFTLDNDVLKIDNKGISMSNFTIQDANKNTFMLSGTIGTKSITNPIFNVAIKADNFQVINATKADNKLIYGKVKFDANGRLTGNLEIPKLDIDLKVSPDTDITYVLPSSSVDIEEREGVVTFVNRENPNAILTQTDDEEKTIILKGLDVNANLKIGNGAKVKIIINEETNDNFQISGTGDLKLNIKPNGILNLIGQYDVKSGHYEMNLYNLVNRRFDLKPGSSVSWYGDPFDAKLDISAIYKLETSASALMASQVSGADPSVKNRFRQVLPFYVFLNIDGELMQPDISFNLDMPENQQGAIGGQVYARVQQVNQQENELNQQVFSLLVLNRFYPQPGSDGSAGGIASIARDNLNDAISDQLNVFSDKILGSTGVELDFGLDSYTDYQGSSPQERTQLDIEAKKKLFNDRLIVSVGSEVDIEGSSPENDPTPLIGNVSLEYLLTEDGRYRLRGFRKNEFENVIDGQTIVSGIAFVFTQEFNKFDELWTALLSAGKRKAKKEGEEEEEEAKNKDKNE